MTNKARADFVLNIYLPLALAVGGLGLVFEKLNVLFVVILAPAVLLLYRSTCNLIIITYVAIASIYAVYSRSQFNLGFDFHDAAAIILCVAIFSYSCKNVRALESSSLFVAALIGFLLLSSIIGLYLGNFYFGSGLFDFRLLGLSTNPNQIALYALSILIIIRGSELGLPTMYFGQIICLLVGALSGSDAFLVAIIVIIMLSLAKQVIRKSPVYFTILTAAAAILLYLSIDLSEFNLDTQSFERINRWIYAARIYLEYPHAILIGLGPGGYGPSFDSTFLDYVDFSSSTEIAGTEFHNSALDFLTSFGLLGLLLFYFFIKNNSKSFLLSPEFFGLMAFSMFHLVYRHPIFWLALLFAIKVTSNTGYFIIEGQDRRHGMRISS